MLDLRTLVKDVFCLEFILPERVLTVLAVQ